MSVYMYMDMCYEMTKRSGDETNAKLSIGPIANLWLW